MTEDELRAFVGRSTRRVTVTVERSAVANFADAVHDPDPVYRDGRAAAAAGLAAIPVPPTFPFAMAHWGAFPELQTQGGDGPDAANALAELIGTLLAGGGLLLHGEQELRYHRPVLVGDVLRGEGRIVDVYVKQSQERAMTFVVDETVWRDDVTGAPVVTSRTNVIHRA